MNSIKRISGDINHRTITEIRNWLIEAKKAQLKKVHLFIERTTSSYGMQEALDFYRKSKQPDFFQNLHTIAGEAVWHAGVFLFLAGSERRITPATLMKLNWNETIEKVLVAETKLRSKRIHEILCMNKVITLDSIHRLGISDGYYIGLPELHLNRKVN